MNRPFTKSRKFIFALLSRLLTPITMAILMFVVIYLLAAATAADTDDYSRIVSTVKYESVVVRQMLQSMTQTITETSSPKLALQYADSMTTDWNQVLRYHSIVVGARATGTMY